MTTLSSIWPLFDLKLTTPRLELRPILDEDIAPAVEAARSGIHDAGRNPFSTPWTELPADELGPNMARWYWRCRAEFTPEACRLRWSGALPALRALVQDRRRQDFLPSAGL